MKTITEQEFRDRTDQVLIEVESGGTFHITRGGVGVAEVRPLPRRRGLSAQELVERHRRLSRIDRAETNRAADDFSGGRDRVSGDGTA